MGDATNKDLAHSPLGASSAERWLNCPGSIDLINRMPPQEREAKDYQVNGTYAHDIAAQCLQDGTDAWERIGEKANVEGLDVEVTQEMADAIQVYLDFCREQMSECVSVLIEEKIGGELAERPHPQYYGTVDFAALDGDTLYVNDFKYGEGIAVDAEDNPQLMYYAYGLLRRWGNIAGVVMSIVQPRAYHHDGPIRTWSVDATYLTEWAEDTLIPAMNRTATDRTLKEGEHCRFCPVKAAVLCPVLDKQFEAMADPVLENISDQALSERWTRIATVKMQIKAVEDETYKRMMAGKTIPDLKLVPKRAFRIWPPDVETKAREQFGDEAFTAPALKGPADMEKLGSAAKKFTKEYAYMPNNGLTVALATDAKPGVKVESMTSAFRDHNTAANAAKT